MIKKVDGGMTTQQVSGSGADVQRAPVDLNKTLTKDEIKEITGLLATARATNQAKEATGQAPIVARYLVVPGPIVPMYVVPSPFPNIGDAMQALINRVTTRKPHEKEAKVTINEARMVRKLFNFAVADAKKRGKDISQEVANYLQQALGDIKMTPKAHSLIFGKGGPGDADPIYYILPPPPNGGGGTDGPPIYYILPPNMMPR